MKRATKDEFISSDYKTNFNPRPHEEGDLYECNISTPSSLYFNPRPHEEGDSGTRTYFKPLRYFNPRPHEEGDIN